MQKPPTYLSDSRPKFEPFEIDCGKIPAYRYKGSLKAELKAKTITAAEVLDPDHAPIANQRPQIVPPLRRQRFLIRTGHDVF